MVTKRGNIVNTTTDIQRKVRNIFKNQFGFGCTYADKRSGGNIRYKWFFNTIQPEQNLTESVSICTGLNIDCCQRIIKQQLGLSNNDYVIQYIGPTKNDCRIKVAVTI